MKDEEWLLKPKSKSFRGNSVRGDYYEACNELCKDDMSCIEPESVQPSSGTARIRRVSNDCSKRENHHGIPSIAKECYFTDQTHLGFCLILVSTSQSECIQR
jgi:hypothetical protein